MTFATESENSDSRRFSLVRITPKKYLGSGTSIGGNTYTFDPIDETIGEVLVNGVSSTFTQTATEITVTSAEDLEDAQNVVNANLDIHVSSGPYVKTDGILYSLPEAEWQPRLLRNPSIVKGMTNALAGVITVNSSNFAVAAHEDFAKQYIRDTYSFSDAPVVIWMCIGSEANNRLVFTGVVTGVTLANNIYTFSISDETSKLRKSATFGSFYHSRLYAGHPDRPYIKPELQNSIAPITIGDTSAYTISPGYRHLDAFDTPNCATYHVSDGVKCAKVDPENPGPTDTVTFYGGRFLGTALKKVNFGTISAAYRQFLTRKIPADTTSGVSYKEVSNTIIYLQTTAQDCEIGDYIPELKGFVCAYGTNIYSSYDVAIHVPNYGAHTSDTSTPTDGTIAAPSIANNTHPQMAVWIEGGDTVSYKHTYIPLALDPDPVFIQHGTRYLPFTTDLTHTYSYLGSTVTHLHFTVDPTETGLALVSSGDANGEQSINPLISGQVKCRFKTTSAISHSDFLSFGCEAAGLTVNQASFDAQTAVMNRNASVTWPYDGGSEFGSYLDYCQLLLRSTFGILKINESSQAEYQLLRVPLTSDGTRDSTDTIRDETACKLVFDDIYSDVKFEHKQIKTEGIGSLVVDDIYINYVTKYLHGKDRLYTVQHVLTNVSDVVNIIGGYYSNPTVEYNYQTTSKDLVTEVGDAITLENSSVASSTFSVTGVVLNVDASASRTIIKINELRGVE